MSLSEFHWQIFEVKIYIDTDIYMLPTWRQNLLWCLNNFTKYINILQLPLHSEGYPSEMVFMIFGLFNLLNKDVVFSSIQCRENTKILRMRWKIRIWKDILTFAFRTPVTHLACTLGWSPSTLNIIATSNMGKMDK